MIEVPVLINHDPEQVLGFLVIDETKLPPIPCYKFSIGYTQQSDRDKYTLVNVGLVPETAVALHVET